MKIAIAGLGVVGENLRRWFQACGYQTAVYDPPKGHGDRGPLAEADYIFICVPTPFTRGMGFNALYVNDVVAAVPERHVIAIKSTLQPGTTDELQAIYHHHKLLHTPEFLSEDTAWEDTMHPTRKIVGYTKESESAAKAVSDLLPAAPYSATMPAVQAELIKTASNSFYALKVAFANQLQDLCQALGVNYTGVRLAMEAEPMLGVEHWKTPHKGYRGYGGKCLPKDIRTLIQAAQARNVNMSLLEAAEAYNNALTGERNAPGSG